MNDTQYNQHRNRPTVTPRIVSAACYSLVTVITA